MKASRLSPNILYHAIFLLLAIAAILFYKERLFVDSSYYIFKSINDGWFHIEHGRTVLALSQIFPLIGKAFGLSLKSLLILYSIGQVIFFYLIFLLMQYHFKLEWSGIAILTILLVGQKWLYFIPMLELLWGGVLSILVLGIIRSGRWKDDKWLLLMLFSWWLVLSSHPLNYLTAAIIVVYDVLDRGWQKKLHYSLIGFFLAALFLELIGSDAYENQKVVGLEESMIGLVKEAGFIADSLLLLLKKYWLPMILGVFTCVRFIQRKRFLVAMLWPAAVVLLYLGGLYRWDMSQDHWYTEVVLEPIVIISIILFVLSHLEPLNVKYTSLMKWVFGFALLGFNIAIFYHAKPMQKRTAQLQQLTEAMPSQKGIVDAENLTRPYHELEWSQAVEALLLSALQGPEAAVSLVSDADMNYTNHMDLLSDSSFLFRRFERMDHQKLDANYFTFKKSKYQLLNTENGLLGLNERQDQISIVPTSPNQIIKIPNSDTSWVEVKIINLSEASIPSALSTRLYLAAHWYHADTIHEWDGARTAIQMDVSDSIKQDVRLRAPEKKGIYEVQFDMVREGEYWLGLKPKYTVQVY